MRVKINGSFYDFFDDLIINSSLDSFASTFSFKARFNPSNTSHRDIFRPLSFNRVEIFDKNDNLILTGVVVNTTLNSLSLEKAPSISGYSLPGVLETSNIPYESYPLESNNVSLIDLTSRLLSPFGLSSVFDENILNQANIIYERTVAEPTETIKSYLSSLAAQRNIIIGHNEKGNLHFFRLNVNSNVIYSFNEQNTLTMDLSVNGQSMSSDISVIRQPSKTNNNLNPVDSIKNPLISDFRPMVKVLSSGEDTETREAVNNALSTQLRGITLNIKINTIENIKKGDIVDVVNREIFLSERTRFVVQSVSVKETKNSEESTFKLVLPEVFTGGQPNIKFE